MNNLLDNFENLHRIPELGMQEIETQAYLLAQLSTLKKAKIIELKPTGILVYFDFQADKTIAFRAEMDGLPIFEQNQIECKSQHNGIMHACGHDGHMSILLALCEYLEDVECHRNVCCIFQPSEESFGGAQVVLQNEFFSQLDIEAVYGLHFWPGLALGKIYARPGLLMASATEVDIEIIGKSAHMIHTEEGMDAIKAAADLIEGFRSREDLFFNCGFISSQGSRNSVCAKASLACSLRTFSLTSKASYLEQLKRQIRQVAGKSSVKIYLNANKSLPALKNSFKLFTTHRNLIDDLCAPVYQAEDFALYAEKYPALFCFLGTGEGEALHTSTFQFPLELLEIGLKFEKDIIRHFQ